MPVEVIMPKVDMDMTAGRIAAWRVAEGERVEAGQALFDIETDKAAMEVESPGTGTLAHVSAAEGEEVAIGTALAWVYGEGEEIGPPPAGAAASGAAPSGTAPSGAAPSGAEPAEGEAAKGAASANAAPEDAAPEGAAPEDAAPQGTATSASEERREAESPQAGPRPDTAELQDVSHRDAGAGRATPAARRAAREARLDLAAIAGSGPHGRVQRNDVREAAKKGATPAGEPAAPAARARAAPAAAAAAAPLSVLRAGTGTATPFLFLHGLGDDGHGWAGLEAHLPDSRPRLKLELPGHGRSPRAAPADFKALAREVRGAVDALDLGAVHVVGHSLGAAVALALADVRPRSVASLALIAPAGLGPDIAGRILDGLLRAEHEASLAPWLQALVADPGRMSWNYVAAAMQARADPELRAAQRAMSAALFPDGTQGFDVTAALGRVASPLRVIWGRADPVIPWRHALVAPGHAALHLLPGIGHMPQIEAPETTAAILGAHLASAEAGG